MKTRLNLICIQICFLFLNQFELKMNHPTYNQQMQVNEGNNLSEQKKVMIEEPQEESNDFGQSQIDIIREYIANLNIDRNQKDHNLKEIAERIQKQTHLHHKSAKEILTIIYKLLHTQNSSKSPSQQHSNSDQPDLQINESPEQFQIQPVKQVKGFRSQTQQHESVFESKSLFKSFHEVAQSSGFKEPKGFGLSENNFPGIRKVNFFTKPSSDIVKAPSNGFEGFATLSENRLSQKQVMQIEGENVEMVSFSKKATKEFRQSTQMSQFRSKRKIRPTAPLLIDPLYSPQEKIEWVESNTHDCQLILQKKLMKKGANTSKDPFYVNDVLSGVYNEYFYSNYDKAYFRQQNQIPKLINFLGFDSKKITLKEFKLIKSALPKPKLFNIEFITSQQNKLNQFRTQLRQLPKQRVKNQEVQLLVGREVTALHPLCGHLHNGTILAIYKESQYIVKFTRPQLGTQKVLDINISTRSLSSTNKATIENLDYESMFMAIKLLEYKRALIQKFKKYNSLIEEMKKENRKPNEQILQQYGWLGSTINILSMGLRHIMVKFRIRGLNPSNQELVGKNFSCLLINPLNLMSKQLQNSLEASDIETSNQIKKMAANRSSNRIEEYLSKISSKNNHFIEQSEMNPEQKQNMSMLVKNFIGMLLNFRYEGRSFNIQSNRYLDNIQKLIDNEYTEEFNEIYANVHTIVKKIGQTQ